MTSQASQTAPRDAHVLVVDDQPTVLSLIVRMLASEGICSEGVSDLERADALLADTTRDFRVIVLDHGVAAAGTSIRLRWARQVPIVVISGDPLELDRIPWAAAFVPKPFTAAALASVIEAVWRRGADPAASPS